MAKRNSFKKMKGGNNENSFLDLFGFTAPFFIIFTLVILLVIFLGAGSSAKLL
jgi:hypothetical protein